MTTYSNPHWMDALEPLFAPSISSRDVANAIMALAHPSHNSNPYDAIKALCVAQVVKQHMAPADTSVVISAQITVQLSPRGSEMAEATQIVARLLRLALECARQREQMARLWMTDALTGLHRRDALPEIARQQAASHGVVICFDLIGFKAINDQFGHAAGDERLVCFANTLRLFFRATDALFRWGGDEFVVLCPDANQAQLTRRLGDFSAVLAGHCTGLQARIGVASYDGLDALPDAIVTADRAMYGAQ